MDYKHSQGLNFQCSFDKGEKLEWRPLTVHRILTNEVYIGTLIQHKTCTPNHKVKKRVEYDRSNWFIVENNHEPIIRRTDFYTVQNLMQRNVRTSPKEDKLHLFSGFVFCGDCKNTMTSSTVTRGEKTYSYMICSTYNAMERINAMPHQNPFTIKYEIFPPETENWDKCVEVLDKSEKMAQLLWGW